MPENTSEGSVLSTYLIDGLLKPNANDLGIVRVYYGDQEYIPEIPAVCVEPANVERALIATSMQTDNEFLVSVLVYCANVEGVEDAQHDADEVAEAVARKINGDGTAGGSGTRFGGLVIYGYVQTSQYGYVVKANKLMRANRMLVYARSRTRLLEA